MSGIVFFGVALAGGVGACARFGLDRFVQRAVSSWGEPAAAKLGILVVNVVGCFLAGVATQLVPAAAMPIVSTGFLGGFTTFSTAVLDAVTLWGDGFRGRALVLALGTWAASWAAVLVGIAVAWASSGRSGAIVRADRSLGDVVHPPRLVTPKCRT